MNVIICKKVLKRDNVVWFIVVVVVRRVIIWILGWVLGFRSLRGIRDKYMCYGGMIRREWNRVCREEYMVGGFIFLKEI